MSGELYFDQSLSLNICTASTSNLPSALDKLLLILQFVGNS